MGVGDVDVAGSRIRSRGVKGRRGTRRVLWREVPEWLIDRPADDRTDARRLLPDLKEGTMRDAMARACRSAKIPLHSPHDLRHRRGSLWHASGMPARELSERTGRSKESMSLDVYTPDAARRRSGRAGSVPAHIGGEVRHPHRGRGRPTCPAPSHVPDEWSGA